VTKKSKLTAERLREILEYDLQTGIFRWRASPANSVAAGSIAGGKPNDDGYLRIGIDGKQYKTSRLAWLYVHGEWPKEQIDHKDRTRHHNWIDNLREATHSQNLINRGPSKLSKTGHKGVYIRKNGRYSASITEGGKLRHLGCYDLLEDAVADRVAAELRIYGSFAHVA
jgi:hypothetical protein